MRPLRSRLESERKRLGLPWEVLERDYLLSWILAGIARVPLLQETLVFKGGTALKKCYFGDYRFSEDLDFTGIGHVPTGEKMDRAIRDAAKISEQLLAEYAPVAIACERYTEKQPHPGGQEAFVIHARFPWHRVPHTRVIVETSVDEKLLRPAVTRIVLHNYGEALNTVVPTYTLEEIIAEKLRAILQHQEKLAQRGWSRSRARDYYDLWRVLSTYRQELDLTQFRSFLGAKCALKNVGFSGPDDFFSPPMLDYVKRTWDQWLGPLVPGLPPFDGVIGELRNQIVTLLAPSSDRDSFTNHPRT